MVEINTTPEARAVADIVKENFRPIVSIFDEPKADKGAVLFVPRGLEAKSVKPFLDEYLQKPRRREGTAKLTELASFNAHVNRFKSSASAIFANNACQPQLIGVLDYHEEGATGDPAFCKHRAVYDFPLSDEWTAWTEKDSEQLGQQAFAEFIEDRLADVLDPAEAGDNAKAFASRLGMHFASRGALAWAVDSRRRDHPPSGQSRHGRVAIHLCRPASGREGCTAQGARRIHHRHPRLPWRRPVSDPRAPPVPCERLAGDLVLSTRPQRGDLPPRLP
jgi:hypothetical protein